ncbi:hypothetical protein [Pseudomonas phage D6]|nr:hypothetical protein [Pseudomonas phage D6]
MPQHSTHKLTSILASLEDSDGVARQVDVTNASASATKDHPEAPTAEADSKGEAATAADTVKAGDSDGVTPAIQNAINEGVQVGEDITKMEACKAALEHHIGQVTKYVDRNESVPSSLAKAIQISLRRHDAQFFAQTVPALESFDAPVGRMTVSLELLDKLKSGAKAVGKGIVEAIKKLIEGIMNAWNFMSTNRDELTKRLEAAEKIIKAGGIKEGAAINYGGLKSLTANGDIVGSNGESVQALLAASEGMMIKWPQAILDLVRSTKAKVKDTNLEDEDEWLGIVNGLFKDLAGTFGKCLPEALTVGVQRDPEGKSIVKTTELPGGREVILTYHNDKLKDPKIVSTQLSSALTVKLERVEGSEPTKEVKVPSAQELAQGITRTKSLLDIGNRRDAVANDLRGFLSEIAMEGTPFGKFMSSYVLCALGFSVSYLGYLNTTTKALVGFYENVAATAGKAE